MVNEVGAAFWSDSLDHLATHAAECLARRTAPRK